MLTSLKHKLAITNRAHLCLIVIQRMIHQIVPRVHRIGYFQITQSILDDTNVIFFPVYAFCF